MGKEKGLPLLFVGNNISSGKSQREKIKKREGRKEK